VLNVRLLRPFSVSHLLAALPKSVRRVCVLDQAGIAGKGPLFLDVVTAFHSDAQWASPMVVAGRVGVDSRGFTPSMAHAVITNLMATTPIANFSVGVLGIELQGENPLPSLALATDAPQSTSDLVGQVSSNQ
jgi:pyruvate-ferredoxin/flavodoxin oxidoreductase